jgi:hypothetical protein
LGNLDHAELRHAILFEVLDLFGSGFTVDRDWNTDINLRYQHLADENRKERLPEIRMNDDKFPAAVSGHYHHPLYGQIQIEKTKDNLVMLHLTPLLTLNLTAVTETEYRGKYQDYFWFDEEKVVFELHPEHKQVLAVQIGQRKWIKEK